ncbi:MAG: peroxiredoxin family protein [Polymorphobacter sp.]|uniref:peroxiredoxin family protein n=1 Tax=Polymorphobacter sp. TaxID=1909290 RepID=UPI003A8964C9
MNRHFFAALGAFFLALLAGPALAQSKGLSGQWRVALDHPGGELPFGLEVSQAGGRAKAWLINPPERLAVEQVKVDGRTITLSFPSYSSQLVLTLGDDGKLSGRADIVRSTGPVTLKASGERGTWRFTAKPAKAAVDLTGRWSLVRGPRGEKGLAQFRQQGNVVTGSVQFPSGDTRYLAGEISGDTLRLSHFDGSSTGLWVAKLVGGKLDGEVFYATSRAATAWNAERAQGADLEAVMIEKPATDRLEFSFPDTSGKMVSLSDPRFKGKVVVITLGGAWCPNCHDEAKFLGPYYERRKKDGLEVISLNFEYGDNQARAFRQMDSFVRRYKLTYPHLLAGQPTPESTIKALGALGPVKVYPSTIFIGRDGKVREVHVGWAGPATGALNEKAKRDFDRYVSQLLREKA